MKLNYCEIALAFLVALLVVVWFVDHQRQVNMAAAAQRQMDRYYWQADKLAGWIEKRDDVKSIDVNVDTITINHVRGQSETFSRAP